MAANFMECFVCVFSMRVLLKCLRCFFTLAFRSWCFICLYIICLVFSKHLVCAIHSLFYIYLRCYEWYNQIWHKVCLTFELMLTFFNMNMWRKQASLCEINITIANSIRPCLNNILPEPTVTGSVCTCIEQVVPFLDVSNPHQTLHTCVWP